MIAFSACVFKLACASLSIIAEGAKWSLQARSRAAMT